ncbi:MAG: AAA family ATPase [Aliarcobacter sp.]|nr:AAA family ATPase [Aliarcobacter sp.]
MPYHKFLTKNPTFKDTVKLETLLYLRYFIAKFKVIHHDEMKEEIEIYFENKNIINEYQNIYDDLILSLPKFIANIKSTKKSIRRDDNKSNDIKELNELEKILLLLSSIDKLISLIKSADNNTNDPDYEIDINLLSDENDENIHFLKEMPSYLKIDFATKTRIKFDELSSGERNLLKLMFSIENIIQKRKDKTDNLYILLEEIETTFHPDWQKRILNWLIGFIKHYDMKFNIIVASHSPFILSDLPKENVIFLKNGKQEYPFKKDEQTFGANIHTLLSHGFFMENGLMGEFAKGKITKIIEILKKEQLSENEIKSCKHIISIIGEPILQKTLEHQLNEKLNPNETELQKLEREQKEIQKKIDELTKKKHETN